MGWVKISKDHIVDDKGNSLNKISDTCWACSDGRNITKVGSGYWSSDECQKSDTIDDIPISILDDDDNENW